MFRNFLLSAAMTLVATVTFAAPVFPPVEIEDLNERTVALPAGLPGKATVVFLAYSRAHQADVENWIASMRGTMEFVQIPVLGRGAGLMRGMINGGMRDGMNNPDLQGRTFNFYQSASTLNDPLEVANDSVVQVFVVLRSGEVVWSTAGQVSQAGLDGLVAAYNGANR